MFLLLRRLLQLLLALLLAWCLLPVIPARADDDADADDPPEEIDVAIEADVDARDAEDLGRWRLTLRFTPAQDVHRAYRIELGLFHGAREVLDLDHSPDVPTPQWRAGETVSWTVPVPVPFEANLGAGEHLDVCVGFFDPEAKIRVRPTSNRSLRDGLLPVADLVVPSLGPTDDEAVQDRILARAAELAREGRKSDAWLALERGLRRAEEDSTKERFRDGILDLGHFDAPPLSLLERQIVAHRIAQEKRRYLRRVSGRFFDQGKLYAALRILEKIGGSLEEEANAAVIGALAEAKRAQKDIQQLQVRLLGRITDEEKAEARKLVEKHGYTEKLLEEAQRQQKAKRYPVARFLFRELSLLSDRELSVPGRRALEALDAAWLAETPPEEAALVAEAENHPAFERLDTVTTHKFVFIGPRVLVRGIPARSRLRFDVAYVFLTDLFGRLPNPGGDRITVFWKELWDFGGGQGGGKTIDIGRADPEKRGYRVDTGLLYHELTHCVDDTIPIFAGWREGLANMGAAYAFEAMDQKGDELHAFDANLSAFRQDYVGRDLEYWRIPGYGPSAGFFLHFLEAHAKTGSGHDWKPYRTFFRSYRTSPVKDGREAYVARAFAYFLIQAFGEAAFEDLLAFRFPLVPSDKEAVKLEVESFARGEYHLARLAREFAAFENSPLPRDLVTREMLAAKRSRRNEEARQLSREVLGILHDWWVIGPFHAKGADPRLCVFPPEYEIDFTKEYADDFNVCTWRQAGDGPVVTRDPSGWINFRYSYQDNTATYALTHVTVPEDVDAFAHVRADDDFVLFVNDRLADGFVNRGTNGSAWLWWRGPAQQVPDAMRLPIHLHAGRNKILVKVKNRSGGAGFALALSRRDGGPLAGLETDLKPPDPEKEAQDRVKWDTVVRHVFRSKSFRSKLDVAVGSFKVTNRTLRGQAKDKQVGWRKYTVRPGFPKDAPSNLAWLRERHTEGREDVRLTLDLAPQGRDAPKLVVTLQGERATDGLSGWNLIVHPKGKGKVAARLERYDRAVYQTTPLDFPAADEDEPVRLVIEHLHHRITVTLGDVVLFDGVPIRPIPNRYGIGFATFGSRPGIVEFRLEAAK